MVPTRSIEIMKSGDLDEEGYTWAFQAMMPMKKIDLAALEAACQG